ncbi:MAG TPA: hypothetical protein VHM02_05745 [Thermoanaerobaculia bacterium]|nr:hypothetical protein [Thermoanaerobaculia bacterium]
MSTTSRRRGGPGGGARLAAGTRVAGAVLLAAGLLAAARWSPAAPPGWRLAERFAFDGAQCEERLGERETAPFTVPAGRPAPLPAAELAGWFRIDAGALCAANGVAAAACAGHAFAPGQEVALPLGRGSEAVAEAAGDLAGGPADAVPGAEPAAARGAEGR